MAKPTPIDPFDQQHWNKPLFVVYGSTGFPQMLCCKVRLNEGVPTIWGFSIWCRTPGFRTLGIPLDSWVTRELNPRFYLSQEEAFDDIRGLFSKVEGQPKPRKGHALVLGEAEWDTLRGQLPVLKQQVVGQRLFARGNDPEWAARHRKVASAYSKLIKAIKEQDPHER